MVRTGWRPDRSGVDVLLAHGDFSVFQRSEERVPVPGIPLVAKPSMSGHSPRRLAHGAREWSDTHLSVGLRQGSAGDVNLKEAARELGVHYQTAYKWVRSGDLAAVRIGSRYEVSPAAINQFLANRRTFVDQADPGPDEQRRLTDLHPEDLLEELEAMTCDAIVTIPAVEGFVARRAAQVLGDTCLVAVDNADGSFRHTLIDHPRADRAAFYNAVIGISGASLMEAKGFLGAR